jgi:hypothetical protein
MIGNSWSLGIQKMTTTMVTNLKAEEKNTMRVVPTRTIGVRVDREVMLNRYMLNKRLLSIQQ